MLYFLSYIYLDVNCVVVGFYGKDYMISNNEFKMSGLLDSIFLQVSPLQLQAKELVTFGFLSMY